MICVVSLAVFSVLGIFSAKYRAFAKEAFHCIFMRATLRHCDTAFDQRMKAKISAKMVKRWPKSGNLVFRRFEAISWGFTALLLITLFFSALGFYNLAAYGSCDPHSTGCVFTPDMLTCGSAECGENGCDCETTGCQAPGFEACEGSCSCQAGVCG